MTISYVVLAQKQSLTTCERIKSGVDDKEVSNCRSPPYNLILKGIVTVNQPQKRAALPLACQKFNRVPG